MNGIGIGRHRALKIHRLEYRVDPTPQINPEKGGFRLAKYYIYSNKNITHKIQLCAKI